MAQQLEKQNIAILWQSARLTLTGEYVVAPEILRVHGSAIGTLGNFSASIGKAKSKKTFNVSAIVAAALRNGTVLQYDAELSENKRKILYVDTEQSPYHCQKVMKRIVRMAGLPMNEEPKNLEFLTLRRHTPDIRIAVEDALPELVNDYIFPNGKDNTKHFDYSELTDERHKEALEATFSESAQYGYSDLTKALKKGYAAIGCIYGENKLVKLKTFLENKRMIVKDASKKYKFNPDYHY
jgi:hypothetical protein